MERTNGSIIDQNDWFTTQNMLFTYSEEEQEENRIAKNNSKLALKPKFIPLYPELLWNWYSIMEALLFGFIDFFLSNNPGFFCTNEQMAELFNCSEPTISAAIKNLEKRWDIKLHKKIKAWWWTIRFITLESQKFWFSVVKKVDWIYNKIINNKNKDIDKSISLQREEKEIKKYWEFWHILLVDEQYDKLRREIWWWLKDLIDDCDRWLELNPRKKYKNYYAFVKNRYKNNQKRIQNEIEVKQKLYANKGSKYIKPNNVISKQNQQQKFQQLLDDNKQYNGWDQNQTTNRRTEIWGESLFSE